MTVDVKTAVILCGGLGSRMGDLTSEVPKPLLEVKGHPIIWYSVKFLIGQGIKKIILPLGYRGSQIQEFLEEEFNNSNLSFQFIDTGSHAEIHERIEKISHLIGENENFLLLNSDTIYDFDLRRIIDDHIRAQVDLTLLTVPIVSPWGIVVTRKGVITRFNRELKIESVELNDNGGVGQVYSGFCILNKNCFITLNLGDCYDFETEVFNQCISKNSAQTKRLDGFWYPIDTPKHLEAINNELTSIAHMAPI